MLNQGVGSWITRRARMSPDRVAMVYEGREWTYRELHRRAMRLAHALAAMGMAPRRQVAYLGQNHPTFLESLFATGLLGAIFVPLNWRLAAPELEHMLTDRRFPGPDPSSNKCQHEIATLTIGPCPRP